MVAWQEDKRIGAHGSRGEYRCTEAIRLDSVMALGGRRETVTVAPTATQYMYRLRNVVAARKAFC